MIARPDSRGYFVPGLRPFRNESNQNVPMRLRFSIRDLLLLTVIVALAIGWWLDHRKLTKENSAEFAVYYLKYADAKDACGSLQKLFAETIQTFPCTYDPTSSTQFSLGHWQSGRARSSCC